MKIRYVLLNAYALGGTTRTVVNQANALCEDHDVEIASVFRHAEKPGFHIDPRVKLIPLTELRSDGTLRTDPSGGPSTRLMKKARRFRTFLPHKHDHRFRRWDPVVDLAVLRYFWSSEDGILVTTRPGMNLLSARMAPRRLVRVAQDHMNFGTYKPGLRAAIVRHYPKLDALTVLTEQDRKDYAQALGGTGLRMERIPNGIPRPQVPPAALDAKVVVAAGRLSGHKGFDMLIDAFQVVHAKHPDWQLWMFGSGAWKKKLTDQIEQAGLKGTAHLKGTTGHLDRQFAAASIFALSSRFEGLPMVLLESMAAGLPAVAFDCPTGPREVIEHGRTGLLVPAEDVAALAAGLCELIEDPARLRAMGAAALRGSEAYSIDTVKQSWERLYGDLLEVRQVGAGRRLRS
ncbi:MAG TPA: glycosyltransferase family 4 protein [Actinoplanes sp.]